MTDATAVTGATGFIGSRLALHARRSGMDVLATGRAEDRRRSRASEELRAADVPVAIGTLQDVGFVRRWCATALIMSSGGRPTRIAHAGGVFPLRQCRWRAAVAGKCRASCGIRRFVYGSSIGVYGDASGERTWTSRAHVTPEKITTRRRNWKPKTSVRTSRIRIRHCDRAHRGNLWAGRLAAVEAVSRHRARPVLHDRPGTNRRQCIHVNDLVRGLMLAAEHPAAVGETFIMAGREVMTTNEMVHALPSPWIASRRDAAADVAVPRGRASAGSDTAAAWHSSAAASPAAGLFPKSFVFSTVKAQAALGFQPEIDFFTGAADTARWYRARGYLPARLTHEVAETESV